MPPFKLYEKKYHERGHGWSVDKYRIAYSEGIRSIFMPAKHEVEFSLSVTDNYVHYDGYFWPDATIHHKGLELHEWLKKNLIGKAIVTTTDDNYIDMTHTLAQDHKIILSVRFTKKSMAMLFKLAFS